MHALNPASRSGINVSAALSCKRMVLPLIDQLHNIAKEKAQWDRGADTGPKVRGPAYMARMDRIRHRKFPCLSLFHDVRLPPSCAKRLSAFPNRIIMRAYIALLAVVLIAQPSLAQPLAPGKPAGVQQARVSSNREAIMLGTGAAIMLTVGLLVSGGAQAGVSTGLVIPSNPVTSVSTTTTG